MKFWNRVICHNNGFLYNFEHFWAIFLIISDNVGLCFYNIFHSEQFSLFMKYLFLDETKRRISSWMWMNFIFLLWKSFYKRGRLRKLWTCKFQIWVDHLQGQYRGRDSVLWWNVGDLSRMSCGEMSHLLNSNSTSDLNINFFCLDVYVSSLKSNFTFQVIIALDIIIMWINFPIKGLTLRAQKNPKTHSLFVHNAISVFLWGFFCFFLYVFYLCVCVCVFVSALSH